MYLISDIFFNLQKTMSNQRNEYTKFGINYISSNSTLIYNHVALHEETGNVLEVKEFYDNGVSNGWLPHNLPGEIASTCGANFAINVKLHVEITAEEFWLVYERVATKLLLLAISNE
jgi:hypothetical protein